MKSLFRLIMTFVVILGGVVHPISVSALNLAPTSIPVGEDGLMRYHVSQARSILISWGYYGAARLGWLWLG